MKELTLACLLLGFCATPFVAGPPPQSSRQTSRESKCGAGFKQCQGSLIEFQEAREFMQLKAIVLTDLNRLEESKPTKPKISNVPDGNVIGQSTRNGAAYGTTVGPNKIASMQAKSAVRPVLLESVAGTPGYRRLP